jgi:endo-1,4-beta-D-glucanase Y
LTPWITLSFTYNVVDNGSATDADLDIATSLLIMHAKTGEAAYMNDALTIINGIWNTEVKDNMLLSGDTPMWNGTKGTIVYNLSYFSPVALRLFAKYDQTHNWTAVLDQMYSYMAMIQANGTGVFPDWSDATTAINPPNKAAGNDRVGYTFHTFNKESVRIPWRIAWDYYWYQDLRALAVLQRLNQFIVDKAAGDPTSAALSVSYSWNLSIGPDDTRNTAVPSQWLAAWCATGLGTNSDWLNKCTDAVSAKTVSNSASSYFSDILLVMYSQLLNGAYVNPFK